MHIDRYVDEGSVSLSGRLSLTEYLEFPLDIPLMFVFRLLIFLLINLPRDHGRLLPIPLLCVLNDEGL